MIKFSRRFRRPAPFLYLVLLLLALIGGLLYIPTNIDTAAYREPRVLQWLGQEQWHWIHTYDPRLNSTGCGFEWLTAPLILFTRTDRFIFLINWVSYLMLPGLIFSVFKQLGVRSRVVWWWMWFLSAGWCFAMQAGSVDNDALAAIYVLAAVDLSLRAKNQQSCADFMYSMLAIALATGVKQVTLPLMLPWLMAAIMSWRLARREPLAVMATALACILVSFIPISIANLIYTGNWMGFSPHAAGVENPLWSNARTIVPPFWCVVGNFFCIPSQNMLPPYFPFAERWNTVMDHFVRTPFGSHFAGFDHFGRLSRFTMELNAGIGPGVCLLTLLAVVGARRGRRVNPGEQVAFHGGIYVWLRLAPWLALFVFMAKIGSFAAARYLAAYYLLLFPLILARPGHSYVVRKRWWQWMEICSMLFTAILLVVSFDRPLFPARAIIGHLQETHPHSKIVASLSKYYAVDSLSYFGERDPLAKDLPTDGQLIGYTSDGGILEPGLWLPLGSRNVEQIRAEDSPQWVRQQSIHYIVVEDLFLQITGKTIAQILDEYNAELIAQATFQSQPTYHPSHIYLVRLR